MNEEFENVVEETNENTVEQPAEEVVEGIELTDTAEAEETDEESTEETKEDSQPQGRYVTNDELNDIVDKRVARKMSKLEREYESKYADYRDTEAVLNAGMGTSNIKEATERMREYYQNEGIKVPERITPSYSKRETEILAKAEANEIIEDGYEAALSEANRLAQKGYENMTEREKIIFTTLGDNLNAENDKKELLKLGAKEELLKDKDFKSFRKRYNSNVPLKEIYEEYMSKQTKPKFETPGSMKNRQESNSIKDFYTLEEARKFSREELDKNPNLFKAIEKSMSKW